MCFYILAEMSTSGNLKSRDPPEYQISTTKHPTPFMNP